MKKYILHIFIALTALLCGCSAATNRAGTLIDDSRQGYPLDGMQRAYKADSQHYDSADVVNIPVNPSDDDESERFEDENKRTHRRADDLNKRIAEIDGVDSATVIINGGTAIVGLTLSGTPDDDQIIKTKKSVDRAVKAFDSEISHVAVSAAPELYERILNVAGGKRDTDTGQDKELFPVVPAF